MAKIPNVDDPAVQAGFDEQTMKMLELTRRQIALAEQVQEENPLVSDMTALTIAGDRLSRERADELLPEVGFERAANVVGSYAKLDWVVDQIEAGRVAEAEVYPHLASWWSGSDPDDTEPRFLRLWLNAARENGGCLTDGAPLPPMTEFTVYRGQMPVTRARDLGIAWSLDEAVAKEFGRGLGLRSASMPGVLYRADVPRPAVLGYLTGRKEAEVVLDTVLLRDIEVVGYWGDAPPDVLEVVDW